MIEFPDTRQIAQKPSKRTLNKIDKQIEAFYYRHGQNIEIRILDISKIYALGRAAAAAGTDIEAAVIAAIAQYRQN
jgi:hypothetical protein